MDRQTCDEFSRLGPEVGGVGGVSCAVASPAMPRALFLLLALAAPLCAQPNVVLITVDDLNTAVGFLSEEPGNPLQTLYPDPAVRARVRAVLTPNLDRLAAEGIPFASAHAASAVCAPSRAALMTGVRPHVSGFYGGMFRDNDVLNRVATLPEYLRAHGYYTAGVGKVYHDAEVMLDGAGVLEEDGPDASRSWDVWINRGLSPNTPTDWSPWSPGEDRFRFGTNDEPLDAQTDFLNAAVVAEALRTGSGTIYDEVYREARAISLPADRPFFLAVGLARPHLPWIVPEAIADLFDSDDLALTDSLRSVFFHDTDDLSAEGQRQIHREGDEIVDGHAKLLYDHGASLDPATGAVHAWREAVRHYLASAAQSDRIVGHLLDALDAGPYATNTLVIVVGDHGYHLGEKTWFGKMMLWEESTSTTLVVRPPGPAAAPGQLRRQPVSLVDVFPTVLSLTGAPALPGLGGADLSPLLTDPEVDPVSTALTQMGTDDYALRTARYRYIRYNRDLANAELYDVAADPDERYNVIDNLAYAGARAEMEAALDAALAHRPVPPPAPTPTEPPPSEPPPGIPPPEALGLSLPLANPSRGTVALRLSLPRQADVRWEAVDALGRMVWRETFGEREAGETTLQWTGATSGVYTLRVFVDDALVGTRRAVVAR